MSDSDTLSYIRAKMDDVCNRIERIERIMYGEKEAFGLATKVKIMWESRGWILSTLSAGLGVLVTLLLSRYWG